MKHAPLAALAFVLAVAGCHRDAEAPVAQAPATTAPEAAPATAPPADAAAPADPLAGTDAVAVVDHATPAGDNTAFDPRAFAGTYAAEGTSLSVQPDGRYTLTVHAESADADLAGEGTWTLEPDGRHVLLDPTDKSEPDRRYEIASADELHPVDGGPSLRRGD
jgi:hypothetical protein